MPDDYRKLTVEWRKAKKGERVIVSAQMPAVSFAYQVDSTEVEAWVIVDE
jgi:hypothetical protein